VVGNAGLGQALIILLLANGISVLTSVSLSAIATNLKVKGGGDYYLISRTLGHEFGGAIGIVVFLAQSVSIAFYSLGFGEAVTHLFETDLSILPQIIAALTICSFRGNIFWQPPPNRNIRATGDPRFWLFPTTRSEGRNCCALHPGLKAAVALRPL
jgi:amino acid transporter